MTAPAPIKPPALPPRIRSYLAAAAQAEGVTVEDVLSTSRRAPVYAARQRVMRQLRGDGFSLPLIGRWMGRHHSTVVHALRVQV